MRIPFFSISLLSISLVALSSQPASTETAASSTVQAAGQNTLPNGTKTQDELSPQDAFRLFLRKQLSRETTPDKLHKRVMGHFNLFEKDGTPGLSLRDFNLKSLINNASSRAHIIQNKLRYDLDGNLEITKLELQPFARPLTEKPLRSGSITFQASPEQKQLIIANFIAEVMTGDSNGDGILTIEEISREAQTIIVTQRPHRNWQRSGFHFSMDINGDRMISKTEIEMLLQQLSNEFNPNGDDKITRDEVRNFRKTTAELVKSRTNP